MDIRTLVLNAQAGDLSAFDQLIEGLVEPFSSRIARIYPLGGRDFAEQVFWGAAELAWEKLATYDPDQGSFTHWFCWRVRQVARDLMREYKSCREDSVEALADKGMEPAIEGPASQYQSARLRERIEQAIDSLPERYCEAFNLYVGEGLSLAETGERIGKSKNAAAHRVNCARRMLARRLGHGWESFWSGADWVKDDDRFGDAA